MEPTSFNSNPSFGMSLEERQRYRGLRNPSVRQREESQISNPSFDMYHTASAPPSQQRNQLPIPQSTRIDPNRFPTQRSSHYELYSIASGDEASLGGPMVPPTPAPTMESDGTVSSSSGSSSQMPLLPTSSLHSGISQDETSKSYPTAFDTKQRRPRPPIHFEYASEGTASTAQYGQFNWPSLLNYANIIIFLASATVTYLQESKVEDVLTANATLLTPAYFVSAVSGILSISTGIWAISQILGDYKHHELVVKVVSWWYVVIASLQIAWYYLFSMQMLAYSLSVMLVQLGCLLFGLQPRISKVPAKSPPEYLILKLPFDLQIAWTIASSAIQLNVAAHVWKLKILYQIVMAGISLFGVFALAIWFVFQTSGQWAIPCLLAWTCLGISVELDRPSHLVSMVERYSSKTITSFRLASSGIAAVLVVVTVIRIALMQREKEEMDTFKKNFEEHRSTGTVSTAPRPPTPVLALYKMIGVGATVVALAFFLAPNHSRIVNVAMIGNSIMYYNDLPRVLEAMSERKLGDNTTKTLHQDSILQGNADFEILMQTGNGMYQRWQTGNARIWSRAKNYYLYDWGACTPEQLLLGYDSQLQNIAYEYAGGGNYYYGDDEIANGDDHVENNEDAEEGASESESESHDGEKRQLEDRNSMYNYGDDWNYDDRIQQEASDINPCHVNYHYYEYYQEKYELNGPPKWDYVVMNDNARSPCCTDQREASMEMLKEAYLPLLLQTGATPIFLATYAYWSSARDMSGLVDIPTFTSYTYAGYRAYAELLSEYLPKSQQPKIAPVGLAFLLVYEEKPSFWEKLIHYDEIHPSPSGTYLEGLVVYHAIYGRLPSPRTVLSEQGASILWEGARRMVPDGHGLKAFPSRDEAAYLYHVAHRICIKKEMPSTLTFLSTSESLDFTPDDSQYEDQYMYGEERQ